MGKPESLLRGAFPAAVPPTVLQAQAHGPSSSANNHSGVVTVQYAALKGEFDRGGVLGRKPNCKGQPGALKTTGEK